MRNNTATAQNLDATEAHDTQPMRTSNVPGERTRLYLADIANPIVTQVARRRETGMTCVQELPFLRIESLVEDDRGRKARIARVALAVDKNVPKLVIELTYVDDENDDDEGSPPGVAFGTIDAGLEQSGMRPIALDSWDDDAKVDQVPTRETNQHFRKSPIDSMREPPITLARVMQDLFAPLTQALTSMLMPARLQLA